jgi:hypothetical protein
MAYGRPSRRRRGDGVRAALMAHDSTTSGIICGIELRGRGSRVGGGGVLGPRAPAGSRGTYPTRSTCVARLLGDGA